MYPGEIKLNTWIFPDIVFDDHHWLMCVRLYKNRVLQYPLTKITGSEFHAEYQVLTWKDDSPPSTYKTPTIIKEGKQKRNVFEQAMFEANKKWTDKKTKHVLSNKCGYIPPMKLKILDDVDFEKLGGEWYCQRKYNGIRCIVCQGKVFSRKLKSYNIPHIVDKLPKEIMFDGELYIHGEPLQNLSSIVRGDDAAAKLQLKFIIFDFYDPVRPKLIYEDRLAELNKLDLKNPLYLAPTDWLGEPNRKKMEVFYKKYLIEGYEGIILRRADAPYLPAFHGRATDVVLKHKPKRTDEFKCVGYTSGRGKELGAVIWIAKTNSGINFNVRPSMPYAERRAIFKELENGGFSKYKGKPITIEYDSLSIDGVPQQPRAIAFRTYE